MKLCDWLVMKMGYPVLKYYYSKHFCHICGGSDPGPPFSLLLSPQFLLLSISNCVKYTALVVFLTVVSTWKSCTFPFFQ